MADNGTSVGVINLGLTVVDTLQQQLASIASRAKKQAGSSFSVVGDAAAKAITAPLDAAVKEAQEAAADAAKPIGKIGEAAAEAITKPVNAAIQAARAVVVRLHLQPYAGRLPGIRLLQKPEKCAAKPAPLVLRAHIQLLHPDHTAAGFR